MLSERGAPTPVAWTRVRAPRSLMAPAPADGVAAAIASSPLFATYGQAVDRQSAHEMLTARVAPTAAPGAAPVTIPIGTIPIGTAPVPRTPGAPTVGADGWPSLVPEPYNPYLDEAPAPVPAPVPSSQPRGQTGGKGSGGLGEMLNNPVVTSFMKSLGTSLGGAVGRSVFGTRKRRR